MEETIKCAHAPCSCPAPKNGLFCSTHCEEASSKAATGEQKPARCHCQHPDCGADVEDPSLLQNPGLAEAVA